MASREPDEMPEDVKLKIKLTTRINEVMNRTIDGMVAQTRWSRSKVARHILRIGLSHDEEHLTPEERKMYKQIILMRRLKGFNGYAKFLRERSLDLGAKITQLVEDCKEHGDTDMNRERLVELKKTLDGSIPEIREAVNPTWDLFFPLILMVIKDAKELLKSKGVSNHIREVEVSEE